MKVKIGRDTYLVHWKTEKFTPKEGKNTKLELEATDCIIESVQGDSPRDSRTFVTKGHVSQTSGDIANAVIARRLSFLKAIKDLTRPVRKALGDEYNRTCRVVPRTFGQKNRRFKQRVKELEKEVKELRKTVNGYLVST